AGCDDIITIVGYERELVSPLVADTITVFQEERKGTGHAVMMARDQLTALTQQDPSATLLVLCGDTPLLTADTISDLVWTHHEQKADASVVTFIADDPTGYGRIIRDASGAVERIVEQVDASPEQRDITEVNSGMYCFRIAFLLTSLDALTVDNKQGEYYLTDTLEKIRNVGGKVLAYRCADANETLGVNDRVQLAAATTIAQQRINQAHMRAGVTMLDPRMVWINPEVVIAGDVELLPLTILTGSTTIGTGCVLGPNTRVKDSTIGAGCVIEESVLDNVVLEDAVRVGPRAYLRPGTLMRTGSKAGTHVEIKKSVIGARSKVPHLSYIGDATIGEDVNIGAATVTCNYDGFAKHATIIGDRSFMGSDTMLVAPVTIGSDVVTGAGSVITNDVPDGALALERTEQRIIEGWSTSRNARIKAAKELSSPGTTDGSAT
ncbi:MAG: bifunctional UDP-N-acetylglucosamine diphosphorylase/glucosamine-1-phosphate N-acetyltransferase GlmU, partial [Coriobacteriia bacterium]|nr:bifunctional UDP-N-acetylglucosamine diphosphorylase/glucosamine-1-phosphate N-acetyltransferase GlmU [Coriobacteriia bacterium]